MIDADAINLLHDIDTPLNQIIPSNSILTPHVGEFKRLVGEYDSESEKLEKLRHLSSTLSSVIILKGHMAAICMPNGKIFFNSSGSSSLSRAGAGDVLSGVIGSYLARGMSNIDAAKLGVFLHGKAAERATNKYGEEAATMTRIIKQYF